MPKGQTQTGQEVVRRVLMTNNVGSVVFARRRDPVGPQDRASTNCTPTFVFRSIKVAATGQVARYSTVSHYLSGAVSGLRRGGVVSRIMSRARKVRAASGAEMVKEIMFCDGDRLLLV